MNPTLTSQSSELSSLGAASRFRQAKLNPREDGNTVSINANAAAETEAGQREVAETKESMSLLLLRLKISKTRI